jgi:drug/metabolite transporter (DMT)-like permease
MTLSITALVLFAALLHASWNALLKGGEDRFWSMTIMGVATALACAVFLPFLPLPHMASWPCILGSSLLHVGYNAFLIRAYRSGEFGAAYPVARGSSPLLVTMGAALTAHELPTVRALAGILLVSGGIVSMAFRGRRLPESGIFYALGTGFFIAAYSVTDGIGGRLSGNAVSIHCGCASYGVSRRSHFIGHGAATGACGAARSGPAQPRWVGWCRCLPTAS